ncbi:transglycosylase SLT domain-containing protein [Roseibium sp. RKSG952]|uniref:transglycosylase SLT domain-containing protein n=1 Tax=Roseibium sp. RKSG952 TaxID=2529384 RepID=UPI0012BC8C93|nr:transglycosylase SLT domain-containing protein [Roseibium sp. RKSG952]MTH99402.1 lytic transglycosylase domain-containing protein [Roseibium sp. RKSG952]
MRVAEAPSIASRIEQAFQTASSTTGTSFDYLVKTALRESSFDPAAKARTSSATGLFQFIESTWLETMKEAGPRHGLDRYSDAIERTSSGRYHVSDPAMRQEILELRQDPEIASLMAGALTQKNADHLRTRLGREPSDGELYMAHFLGATGASRLIEAANANGQMRADVIFGKQAEANRPIFYHQDGSARTLGEVYEVIVSKHDAVNLIASVNPLKEEGIANVAALPGAKPVASAQPSYLLAFSEQPSPMGNAGPGGQRSADREDGSRTSDANAQALPAFHAGETSDPFEALFRNDRDADVTVVSGRLDEVFAAVQANPYSAMSSASSRVLVQQMASLEDTGPLDLARVLQFDKDRAQRDLLPPV